MKDFSFSPLLESLSLASDVEDGMRVSYPLIGGLGLAFALAFSPHATFTICTCFILKSTLLASDAKCIQSRRLYYVAPVTNAPLDVP